MLAVPVRREGGLWTHDGEIVRAAMVDPLWGPALTRERAAAPAVRRGGGEHRRNEERQKVRS